MEKPIKPVVSLHSTARDAMIRGYVAQIEAVYAAISALSAHAPHGRDYADEEQWLQAVREHRARVSTLFAIHAELTAIAEGL